MATDIFLVFPKPAAGGRAISSGPITAAGETRDKAFAQLQAVELHAFQLGTENPTTLGTASAGAGAGKAKFLDFQVTKLVDRASPALYTACATGAHFPQVELYVRKAGTGGAGGAAGGAYLKYSFRMVYVTTITWSENAGDEAPTEMVTFAYGALGIQYYMQKPDGTLNPTPPAQWSQVTNSDTLDVPAN